MPAGDLIVADEQWEWGGLLLGPGTDYEIVSHKGILDSPDLREGDQAHPSADGDVAGYAFYGPRLPELTVDVYGTDDLSDSMSDLMDACVRSDTDAPLVFQLSGWGKRRVNARFRQRSVPVTHNTPRGLAERVRLLWKAADPRLYDNTETSNSSPNTLANDGNYPTWPTITLTAGATITNTTTSKAIVTTGTGTLIIDTRTRTVTKAGVNAYDQIDPTTEWFSLVPGNNVLTGTATTVVYRDAWV